MATIDYKQKIKDYMNSSEVDTLYKSMLNNLFPELKESEDEKIRKELIEFVKSRGGFKQEYIAWLEKQGEHANFRNKIQVGDKVTRNEDSVLVNLSQLNRVAKKQGEQKSAKFDDTNVKLMFIKALERVEEQNAKGYKLTDCDKNSWWEDFKAFCSEQNLVNSAKTCKDEQKQNANCLLSWSEIDEKMFQSLEGIVKDYWAKAEQEKNEIKIREASDVSYFLKTIQRSPLCWIKCSDELPNRDGTYLVVTDGKHNDVYDMARYDSVEGWHKASDIIYWMPIPRLNNKSIIWQKPAWSEEDETVLNNLIYALANDRVGNNRDEYVNWLKSLKDRYTWKPSEEQMSVIEAVINNKSFQRRHLDSLYNDLKKLKQL